MTRVLALDLATKTGWAYDALDGRSPISGTYVLPHLVRNRARAFLALHNWIEKMVDHHAVDALAWEEPLTVYAHAGWDGGGFGGSARKDPDVAYSLIGLAVVAQLTGARLGLRELPCNVQTVRMSFMGRGRPANPKAAVLAQCSRLGWRAEDHNAADAIAVWYHAKVNLCTGWQPSLGIRAGVKPLP